MFQNVLFDNVKDLYLNTYMSDCQFILDDGENIPAHKVILSLGSKVFKCMFYGSMKDDTIKIIDEPHSFKSLLRCLYGCDVKLESIDHALSTYAVSDKYDSDFVKNFCENFIISCVDANSACYILQFSIFYDNARIKDACMEIIKIETKNVMNSENFLNCNTEILCIILKENLNLSEIRLFYFVEKWAENLFKTKGASDTELSAIKRVIYNFRFLTMKLQEFIEGPYTSNLLSESDQRQLLLSICNPDTHKVPEGFNDSRIPRVQSYPSRWLFEAFKNWTVNLNKLLECQVSLGTFLFNNLYWKVILEVFDIHNQYYVNISLVCIGHDGVSDFKRCTVEAVLIIKAQYSGFKDKIKVFPCLTFSSKTDGRSFILMKFKELLKSYSHDNKMDIKLELKTRDAGVLL